MFVFGAGGTPSVTQSSREEEAPMFVFGVGGTPSVTQSSHEHPPVPASPVSVAEEPPVPASPVQTARQPDVFVFGRSNLDDNSNAVNEAQSSQVPRFSRLSRRVQKADSRFTRLAGGVDNVPTIAGVGLGPGAYVGVDNIGLPATGPPASNGPWPSQPSVSPVDLSMGKGPQPSPLIDPSMNGSPSPSFETPPPTSSRLSKSKSRDTPFILAKSDVYHDFLELQVRDVSDEGNGPDPWFDPNMDSVVNVTIIGEQGTKVYGLTQKAKVWREAILAQVGIHGWHALQAQPKLTASAYVFLGGTLDDFVGHEMGWTAIMGAGSLDNIIPDHVAARYAKALLCNGRKLIGSLARICAARKISGSWLDGEIGKDVKDQDEQNEMHKQDPIGSNEQLPGPVSVPIQHKPPCRHGLPEEFVHMLEKAQGYAGRERHVEAVKTCLPILSGPEPALQLLNKFISSWEEAERKCVLRYEEEVKALTAQLMDAKDRSSALRRQKDAKDAELLTERQHCREAKDEAKNLRRQLQQHSEVVKENARLKQQLRNGMYSRTVAPSREEVIRQVAKLECEPLQRCSMQDVPALKKKLLLKWHPDKQPSTDHGGLATQVMQELQNCEEWQWSYK